MILDSSALIAIICREAGYEGLLQKINRARSIAIGAPTVSETQLAITIKAGPDYALRVEQFLGQIRAIIIPFGRDHLSFFFDAFRQYGKGRHPARLNMGDCFTYAVAKATGLPLLFVGEDFKKTDLTAA